MKQCYLIVYSAEKLQKKNLKVIKIRNGRLMGLSSSAVCGSKKSKFIKEQDAKILLSSLEIKTSLSKILLVTPILFRGLK